MEISKDLIQKLRDASSVSVMVCKRALEKAGGNYEKALEILKEENAFLASKKSDRETKSGIIQSYVHGGRIGVIVELKCETDFVARSPDFVEFSKDIAMHIAASNPFDAEELKLQPYIKNSAATVGDYIKEAIGKFGENIEVTKFCRFEL